MSYRILLYVLLISTLSACSSFWMAGNHEKVREGSSSSLVDYLYPDGEIPPTVKDQMPYLELPLRIGIAFVPSRNQSDLSAAEKQNLLEHVAESFRGRPYVESIQTIPDNYMSSANGAQGMRQVAALYGADVMALVSYDQISFSSERDSAVLYWTIVGAFTVKGNSNEVQTMIDTAVFDVKTTQLLFRAPGTHKDQANATLMDTGKDLRKLRAAGFTAAADDMIVNLDTELDGFRAAIEKGERAEVEWRAGSSGGGSLTVSLLFLLLVVALLRERGRRRLQPVRVGRQRRR